MLAPLGTRLWRRAILESGPSQGKEVTKGDVTPSSSSWLLNPLSVLDLTLPLRAQVTPWGRVGMQGKPDAVLGQKILYFYFKIYEII